MSGIRVDPHDSSRSDRRSEVKGDAPDTAADVEDVHPGTHVRQEEREEPLYVAVCDVPLLHALFDYVALIDS